MTTKRSLTYQEQFLFDDTFFNEDSHGDCTAPFPIQGEALQEGAAKAAKYQESLAYEKRTEKSHPKETHTMNSVSVSDKEDKKAEPSHESSCSKIRMRGKNQRLKVSFADGTVFCGSSATETMVQAIKKLGIEQVASLQMEVCHIPLLSQKIVPQYAKWTKEIKDGWFLMVQSDTRQKFMQLTSIVTRLRVDAHVEIGDYDTIVPIRNATKPIAHRRKSRLCVVFPDRQEIASTDHQHVFIASLQKIGIGNIRKANFKIAGKQIVTPKKEYPYQVQLSSGEWLTVPPLVKDKCRILRVISSMTHVPYEVTIAEEGKNTSQQKQEKL